MSNANQGVESSRSGSRPTRRSPSWIIIFAIAMLAFYFLQRNRGAQPPEGVDNRPAAGAPESLDQHPENWNARTPRRPNGEEPAAVDLDRTGESRGGALDRAFGAAEQRNATGDASEVTLDPATGRAGSTGAKTTRGDWSMEEVDVHPSAAKDPAQDAKPQKTKKGDWEMEIE